MSGKRSSNFLANFLIVSGIVLSLALVVLHALSDNAAGCAKNAAAYSSLAPSNLLIYSAFVIYSISASSAAYILSRNKHGLHRLVVTLVAVLASSTLLFFIYFVSRGVSCFK